MKRYRVWFVDDLPANRRWFEEAHRNDFEVRTFETPSEVLDSMRKYGPPDALLCDIYFYDSVQEAERIESTVGAETGRLRDIGDSIRANRDGARKGIDLIEEVSRTFRGKPPFPVYVYSSKGHYLLAEPSFERISKAGARWIFKREYDPRTETWVIDRDIRDLRRNMRLNACWRFRWAILAGTGIVGWLIGKAIETIL